MMIHNTVNASRIIRHTADRAQEQPPPPPPVRTVRDIDGTIQHSYMAEAITSHKLAPGIKGVYKYQLK